MGTRVVGACSGRCILGHRAFWDAAGNLGCGEGKPETTEVLKDRDWGKGCRVSILGEGRELGCSLYIFGQSKSWVAKLGQSRDLRQS